MSRASVKRRRRPFGVYAITILALINQALIVLPNIIPNLHLPPEILSSLPPELVPASPLLPSQVLAAITTLGTLLIIAGLWAYRRWAWVATMLIIGLYLAYGLWRYLQGIPNFFSMFLDVTIVFYMNQREIQNAFERRRSSEARP
jgi:hypothetical protein